MIDIQEVDNLILFYVSFSLGFTNNIFETRGMFQIKTQVSDTGPLVNISYDAYYYTTVVLYEITWSFKLI